MNKRDKIANWCYEQDKFITVSEISKQFNISNHLAYSHIKSITMLPMYTSKIRKHKVTEIYISNIQPHSINANKKPVPNIQSDLWVKLLQKKWR